MRTVTSTLGSLRHLAALGVSLGLAACGSSQNWHDSNPNAAVGGTVSGLSGGTLALWNNGGDKLTVTGNGSFEFPLQVATGSGYAVVVAAQPVGQTCTVTNGSGTASSDVNDVAVSCQPYTFTRRSLPAIYSTGKAVNYSPYRTLEGPRALEVPSDTDVLQDLTLLHTAGFDLLRLFGSEPPATDVVAEKVLRIAGQYYPDMKFQLGIALGGLTSCSDPKNDSNVSYLITKLAKYPNVATISVGNETSFYSKYMPLACLENYIRTIRSQVTQPVTADDDFSFYAGQTSGGGDRVTVKPDTILALIDFASIHMYPMSRTDWNWQQTTVAAGPDRAKAMMETSLATAKGWFSQVATYKYVGPDGVTVTVGDSMPIVIGETGWKARQTNPASELESYAAKPENAKWYYDLLYGNPGKYAAWQGSSGGPSMIFYFEATDEAWKGTDDGWGLWDASRTARYALCGTPAGPACKSDVYEGAGYYNPAPFPFATITFDSTDLTYSLTGFAGAEDSQVVADPVSATNKVARVNRSAAAATYAGTVVSTGPSLMAGNVPFDASNTRMTVRVYSPNAGITVRLKVEDATNSSHSVETDAVTTTANAWETLTFDFANQASGTAALNLAYTYNRLTIFFNFGVSGATAGAKTYYFDDVTFSGGGGTGGGGGGGGGGGTAPTDAPATVIPSGSTTVYSDAGATAGFDSCPNWGQATVCAGEQTIAGNKSLKYTNLNYEGLDWSSSPLDVSGKGKLHIDFWSPDLTSVKVSIISAGKENAYTQALTTGSWNSVDIDLSNYTVPDKTAIIQIKLESATPGTLYVDNIYFWGTPSGGGGGGGTALVFASNYAQVDPANWTSTEGGAAGTYIDTSVATQYWWNGVAPGDATPSFYFGYGINVNAKPWGFGAFVKAPGNGTADVSGKTNLKIAVWGNDELMNTHPTLTLILKGPAVSGCTSELKGSVAVAAPGVQNYTVALSSFTLQTPCAYASAAAALAAGVTEVHIQVLGANVQYVTGTSPDFPNGLNVGPISFQ